MSEFDLLYHSLISESPMLADRKYREELNNEELNTNEAKQVIEISSLKENYNTRKNIKIRSLIKELKLRNLTQLQKSTFNKLIVRYTWI